MKKKTFLKFIIRFLVPFLLYSLTLNPFLVLAQASYQQGDVNHDSKVDETDAEMVLVNFGRRPSDVSGYYDPTGDTKINAADFAWVAKDWASTSPSPTPLPTSVPGTGYTGEIKITASKYSELKDQINGLGPFLVYAFLSNNNFNPETGLMNDGEVKTLQTIHNSNDPNVSRLGILFTSLEGMDPNSCEDMDEPNSCGVIDDVPSWIDVIFYSTEPGYTPEKEYETRKSTGTDNCVYRATNLAHAYGFPLQWGPLPGALDFHYEQEAASDGVLELLAGANMDGFVSQYQSRIGSHCPDNLIWGPLSGKDTVEETVTHLDPFFDYDFEFCVQVMPDGCNQGQALNCSGVNHYCRDFAEKLHSSGFMDYLAIWVPTADLIRGIRGQ